MKENGIFLILILLTVSFNCDKNILQPKSFLKTNALIQKASNNTNSKSASNSSPASSNSNGSASSISNARASNNSSASASSNSNASASSSNAAASSNSRYNPNTPTPTSPSSTSNSSSSSNANDNNSTSTTTSSNTSSQNVTDSDNSSTSNNKNSNSNAEEESICAEVTAYKNLLLEVDQSIEELMHAFEDHYKDLVKWANSSEEAVDRQRWKESVQDMLDYYINKTGELLRVYDKLNNSVTEMKAQYCAPKPNVTETKNSTEGKKAEQTLNISYNTSTTTTEQKVTTPQNNESTTAGAGESSVMTIFIQKMQEVATKAGLPTNYVQTRLREISRTHNRRMKRFANHI